MTAIFYFGFNSLTQTATLTITGCLPGGLAINPETLAAIVGNNANAAVMIEELIDSDGYSNPADYTTGLGTSHDSVKRLEYL